MFLPCLLPAGHFGMCYLSNLGFFLTWIWCPRHSWLQPCPNTLAAALGFGDGGPQHQPSQGHLSLRFSQTQEATVPRPESSAKKLSYFCGLSAGAWPGQENDLRAVGLVCSHAALCEGVTGEPSQGIMTPGHPGIFLNSNLWDTLALFGANCSFSFSAGILENFWNMCV